MGQGIDISQHNGFINWDEAIKGLDFVIIRCGFGQDSVSQDDPTFEKNVNECIKRNIPYGVYFYSYALNITSVQGEINHVLRLLKGKNPSLPVFIDMEDADGYKRNHGGIPSRQVNTDIVKAFCNAISKAGYKAGWYCNKDWYENHFYPEQLSAWNFWYARPAVSEATIKSEVNAQLWQNGIGETGSRWNGVNGYCDTDISYLDGVSSNNNIQPQSQPISAQSPIEKAKQFVGNRCLELQEKLNKVGYHLSEDGIFGQNTYNAIIDFQGKNGLTQDGLAGSQTFAKLDKLINNTNKPKINSSVLALQKLCSLLGIKGLNNQPLVLDGIKGQNTDYAISKLPLCGLSYHQPIATKFIQSKVGANVDSVFGTETDRLVKVWQRNHGLVSDGVVGQKTWESFI